MTSSWAKSNELWKWLRSNTQNLMGGATSRYLTTAAAMDAMVNDALDTSKMNVNPGVKQRIMRDTVCQGMVQKMNYSLGLAKGMHVVMQERGG